MELLHRVVGPVRTNVWILGDESSREAVCIDAATPSVDWITASLSDRGWSLRLVISSHRHWDHIGDNAVTVERTGAQVAAHLLDRHGLVEPRATIAPPFPIVPCVPALDLAEGSVIRFGDIRLDVLHTPGHTEGSVCLLATDERLLFTGDTLFAGAWGRTDLPGGSAERMVESLGRLAVMDADLRVLPGHGQSSTIERERPWLAQVVREQRLPM